MENAKSKQSKIIYDPLNLYNPKEAFIMDDMATQFEFRVWYESFREKGVEILIKSRESFDYFNQFLPDVKARAHVEKHTPSAIFQRESGINFPETIDDVISDAQEVQVVKRFLSGGRIRKTKFAPSKAFDFLLEALHGVPNRALTLGENYQFLSTFSNITLKPKLLERFTARLHPILQNFITERRNLERFKTFFWVHIILHLSSSLASVKAILGAGIEEFTNVPHKLMIEMFQGLVASNTELVRLELKTLPLTNAQRTILLEVLNIEKDFLFEDALKKRLDNIKARIQKGDIILQGEIEPLRDHIFAVEHQRKIDEIANFLQIQERFAEIEAGAVQAMSSLEGAKRYYSVVIAPLSLMVENLRRSGSYFRPIVDKKWLQLMEKLDRDFATMIKSKFEELKKRDRILIFPEILRSCYDRSQRLVIVFIDALPYDFWIPFKTWLKDQSFLIEEHPLFCLLPSETRFNKRSLFLGDVALGFDPEKDEIADSTGISAEEIIYEKVADRLTHDELQNIMQKNDWKIFILSFNILDERIKDPIAPGDLLNCIEELQRKLLPVVSFAFQMDVPVIFVSDHGIREMRETLDIKVENLESRRWIALEKIEQLPDDPRIKVINDRVFAVGGISFSKINQPRYDHGGLSLRELIVPVAVATPKKKSLQPPQIVLESSEVEENEESFITFRIFNPNDRELFLKRLQFESCELPIDNIWVPYKRDIAVHYSGSVGVRFKIWVGKIAEFDDEGLGFVTKRIKVTGEYQFRDKEKQLIDEEFILKVFRSAKTVDRGRIEKELEDLL